LVTSGTYNGWGNPEERFDLSGAKALAAGRWFVEIRNQGDLTVDFSVSTDGLPLESDTQAPSYVTIIKEISEEVTYDVYEDVPRQVSIEKKIKGQDPLYIQCGANSGQGMFINRYDCRPEALYRGVFNPNVITINVNGIPKDIKLTKLVTKPWEEATASLEAIDYAFGNVNSYRARAGAQQNRLEFTSNSLAVSFTNLEEANSRITDADMAKEMMNLTKSNVLMQAGMSILAQANSIPQDVLTLLN
jgi:flagellin-like hook-associated protein FlgL